MSIIPSSCVKCSSYFYHWKWYVLLLSCMVTLGGYYSFDFVSVLHNQLYRHFSTSKQVQTKAQFEFDFNLLYAVYSFPNMILPWIGGILSDKYGNNFIMFIFATLVLIGNIFQTYAIYHQDMFLFIIGRFIFGIGAETLQVCANIIIAKWFFGLEVAFALGINLSACKLGGVLTDWISPYLEKEFDVVFASLVVTLFCLLSYLLTILLIVTEPYLTRDIISINEYSLAKQDEEEGFSKSSSLFETNSIPSEHHPPINTIEPPPQPHDYYQIDLPKDNPIPKLEIEMVSTSSSHLIVDDISEITIHEDDGHSIASTYSEGLPPPTPRSYTLESNILKGLETISDELQHLSTPVWFVFFLTFLMYGTFIPFNNISNAVILEVFYKSSVESSIDIKLHNEDLHKHEIEAAVLQSIPYFLTIFLNPPLGMMVDVFGYRIEQLMIACLFLCLAHLLIYFTPCGPVIPLSFIGVSFSIFGSVIWPCVPIIVHEQYHGTAYGLMAAFQNTGQFIVPLIITSIYKSYNGYRECELFLACLAFLAFLVAGILFYLDKSYYKSILQKPGVNIDQLLN